MNPSSICLITYLCTGESVLHLLRKEPPFMPLLKQPMPWHDTLSCFYLASFVGCQNIPWPRPNIPFIYRRGMTHSSMLGWQGVLHSIIASSLLASWNVTTKGRNCQAWWGRFASKVGRCLAQWLCGQRPLPPLHIYLVCKQKIRSFQTDTSRTAGRTPDWFIKVVLKGHYIYILK